MRTKAWGLAASAGLLVLGLAAATRADLPKAGKAAPAWSGKTVAGKPITSTAYKGKVILMNFFSYG